MPRDENASRLFQTIAAVRERIRNTCVAAGRNPDDVKLLLATKTVPAENIRTALDLGENLIGENRVQEFAQKIPLLCGLTFAKHFIGHLQTNKVKQVLKYADCIQSVDRIELAEKLDQRLLYEGRSIDVFIQVNTSFEQSKFGVGPDDALPFIRKIRQYDTMTIKGLMTIGLFAADAQRVRQSFRLLREIRDKALAEGTLPHNATGLSMGMSGDFECAIQEGATIIRVGTAIFGSRDTPDTYYWPTN